MPQSPTHIVEFFTDDGSVAEAEATVCYSAADMISAGGELIRNWPRIRVWDVSTGASDDTENAMRLIAASYEAAGYSADTMPSPLIDYASADVIAAHEADQLEQLSADLWRERRIA